MLLEKDNTMLDVVNLPTTGTTIECNLSDLPPVLDEKVQIHLLDQEKVTICFVTKYGDSLQVQVLTPSRVACIHGWIEKGKVVSDGKRSISYSDTSLLLKDFIGLRHLDRSDKNFIELNLDVLGRNLVVGLRFRNKEKFLVFANTLLRFVDEIQIRSR